VQRKIGRNAAYGVRIPRTLASDKAWYAVNHGVGKAGVFMSIGMIIFSIVLAHLPSTMSDHLEDALLCAALVAPLILVLGIIVATNIELKKLDGSKGDWHADREEMS
jgi:SdpI/YfhL protein family